MELDEEERAQVERWLEVPPPPERLDPGEIPREHRQLFIDTVREVIAADKVFDPEEKVTLELFEQLLRY